jgi:hypothetical protein
MQDGVFGPAFRKQHWAPIFIAQSVCQSPISESYTDTSLAPTVSESAFPVPDAASQLSNAASQITIVPSPAAGSSSSCAAAQAEHIACSSFGSPTPAECHPSGRSNFWCVFQVWIARPHGQELSHPATEPRSRSTPSFARTIEFHVRQG